MSRPAETCPCGRPLPYAQCCGVFHAGIPAPDAESLMRSRYVAFAMAIEPYLLDTWHPETRPAGIDGDAGPKPRWIGLQIRQASASGDSALVEFVARYRIGGRAHRLHERSRFRRLDGRWYYVDGDLL